MSRRRELARRLAALGDIAGILSAMRSLALMESRVLQGILASQRALVSGIELAAADFLAWHGPFAGLPPTTPPELCVLIGSEQGFCGDFNEAMEARVRGSCANSPLPGRWLVVGQRLCSRLGDHPLVALALPGASVADEVPTTLLRLTAAVGDLLASDAAAGGGLSVLHHSAATGEIRLRRLLPLRELPEPRPYPFAVELNLPPADVLVGLSRHYLHAALSEALLDSLMAENRQRELHMDRALRRLDDDTERLRRACNAQRQAEIIEEIEILLLSADLLANPRSAS
jgi:F-type H+-transporting ATPase subunit gamma